MAEFILTGIEGEVTRVPASDWRQQLARAPERISQRLDFMTDDHHRVRYFVVEEMQRAGRPVEPGNITDSLRLPPSKTTRILDDLEKHLFFVVRDDGGAVTWAFPVTTDETPHRLVFNTGERLYAA